jgi:SOS-response transcriptional repressor LexA
VTTHREKQLLDFIVGYVRTTGTVPTYREMATGMGMASKSSIATWVDRLIERGLLRRQRGKYMKQNIVLTGQCPVCGREA